MKVKLEKFKVNIISSSDSLPSGHKISKYELNFRHGICVPSSCSNQKSLEYANRYLSQENLIGSAARCQTNDPLPFEVMDIVTMLDNNRTEFISLSCYLIKICRLIFSSIGLLMIASTIYEVSKIRNNRKINEFHCPFHNV
ncbi:CLUMA_CG002885, isoform A [Clunio marinus]|uniref:CLUMA_CG002885, isoform A n=1 Tax=Clunio marinus TaxID=568069 RepID=A0A1J1HLN4_9DIPT|nr:CLUMA_CG002885, isoform A [Clunio marinus]